MRCRGPRPIFLNTRNAGVNNRLRRCLRRTRKLPRISFTPRDASPDRASALPGPSSHGGVPLSPSRLRSARSRILCGFRLGCVERRLSRTCFAKASRFQRFRSGEVGRSWSAPPRQIIMGWEPPVFAHDSPVIVPVARYDRRAVPVFFKVRGREAYFLLSPNALSGTFCHPIYLFFARKLFIFFSAAFMLLSIT